MSRPSFETFERYGLHAHWHSAHEDPTKDRIYLDLIWELTEGLARYVIPRYHRDAGVSACGEPYALVDWEYEVEAGPESEPTRESIRDFVPPKSAVSRPAISTTNLMDYPGGYVLGPPSPYEAGNADKAGLFRVWSPDSLAKVFRGLLADASAELNLFAVQEDRLSGPERLLAALTGADAPRLADVLGPEDVFVDLIRGVDTGYADVLLIQSHSDLSAKLEALLDG